MFTAIGERMNEIKLTVPLVNNLGEVITKNIKGLLDSILINTKEKLQINIISILQ